MPSKLQLFTMQVSWWVEVTGFRHCKRLVDILVATAAILVLSPLTLLVALLIRRDGGPIFYWQTRVGRNGTRFHFPKFRSMVVDADRLKDQLLESNDHREGVTFKMKDDPRITAVGRFIRRFSIDELPQLWCVLQGHMSLVGPRPPLPREVALYTLEDRQRLTVKPGLTCIWQVEGRGDIPFPEQVALDRKYIQNRSLLLDFELLFRTVPAVLAGRGAY